ncbi:uncharacterized protein L969DRAFT_500520 [Mixia osmundae IAM 14324]|uniref:uncharacterized protein n=1 Tax=Mixia osmundae (strain CBS 9802 / IAM 14324 / JCM 22182 / KY 12970) TaxID=764103 RepID=UPI0004A555D8|nr:uncharacterized protein L969DRAFT_500520 [Mixia osmundae IAM 14324]KEI38952.1 hypothetical protein L969DRAFT_500520 [Mixia osmundae IAM 14324]
MSDQEQQILQAAAIGKTFVQQYYTLVDEHPRRPDVISALYKDSARISWNGNPILGRQGAAALLSSMPWSWHKVRRPRQAKLIDLSAAVVVQVQSFDSQPVLGSALPGQPCSVLVCVSGICSHSSDTLKAPMIVDDRSEPTVAEFKARENESELLPRVFSATFMLVPLTAQEEALALQQGLNLGLVLETTRTNKPPPRYWIVSDAFRFVG